MELCESLEFYSTKFTCRSYRNQPILILSQFSLVTHTQAEDCRANNKKKLLLLFLFGCISIIIRM